MATLEQIADALRKADAAGNVDDARALAAAYRQMQSQPAATAAQSQADNSYFADLPIPGGGPGYVAPNASAPVDPRYGEWQEPGAIVPIQFQRGTGAMRLAVPGLVTDAINAMAAPGKAIRGEYDEVEVLPDGSVSRFDPDMMNDATSLAGVISPVTPAARLGGAAVQAVTRQATPEIDDLYAAKDAAYRAVDSIGARYEAAAIDDMATEMLKRAGADNISPEIHPKAFALLARVQNSPREMSLTQLDQLRQQVRRDLVQGDKGEAHFGNMFIDVIDDFIAKTAPSRVATGTGGDAANSAILAARKAHSILRKSETLEDAMTAARLRAASSGSGGNIDNSIRQELRKIITSEKKSRGFTKAELDAMEGIVVGGGKMQDVLRLIGKLSPSGNGLMAALGLGATIANPLAAAAPAAGLVAKTLSDRATTQGVNALTRMVRTGEPNAVSRLGSGTSPVTPNANVTLIEQNLPDYVLPRPNAVVRLSL